MLKNAKNNYFQHYQTINVGKCTGNQMNLAANYYYDNELNSLLPQDKTVALLELGSGYGYLLKYLSGLGYLNLTGIEIDQKLAKISGAIHADALDYLSSHKQHFDIIIAFDFIEHFEFKTAGKLLQLIRNSLKPNGYVILRTPNAAHLLGNYSRYLDLTHYNEYTEQSLTHLFQLASFSSSRMIIPNWSPWWNSRTLRFYLNTLIHKFIYWLSDRTIPHVFDKNLLIVGYK